MMPTIIWACPICEADLEIDGVGDLWCPECEQIITTPQLAGDYDA